MTSIFSMVDLNNLIRVLGLFRPRRTTIEPQISIAGVSKYVQLWSSPLCTQSMQLCNIIPFSWQRVDCCQHLIPNINHVSCELFVNNLCEPGRRCPWKKTLPKTSSDCQPPTFPLYHQRPSPIQSIAATTPLSSSTMAQQPSAGALARLRHLIPAPMQWRSIKNEKPINPCCFLVRRSTRKAAHGLRQRHLGRATCCWILTRWWVFYG